MQRSSVTTAEGAAITASQQVRYLSWRNSGLALGIAARHRAPMFNTRTHSTIQGILSACTVVSWRRCGPKRHVAILFCIGLNWWRHPVLDNVARLKHLRV